MTQIKQLASQLKYSRRDWMRIGLFGSAVVLLAACGGDSNSSPTAAPAANAPAAGSGGAVTLEISSAGDDSRFDKEKLEAPGGSKITLKFTNNAKGSKLFNWVLTQPDKYLKVVNDGTAEGEANGFVKPNDENVIAHTKLLKVTESDTITFDAPPPGEYPYICTNPGYYTRMKGVLVIK